MPNDVGAISIRPVEPGDLSLLGEWMRRPYWREWWGEPEYELGLIRDMIEGRDTTRPYIIEVDGEPAGYIQVWFIGHHQNESWINDHPWLAELPPEAVGVDLSIGEAGLLSKGIGSAALSVFVRRLLDEGCKTVVIDPDPANRRAVRAYEKAGFRPIPELLGRTGDSLIMQFDFNETSQ